ncbi:MAG: NTPase [Nitrososphaerales archaeon]|nr:NTPase [Nitrososphaerales archaeon]
MRRIWAVTGPPGVGKSTVVSKVVLRLKSHGVIVGGCTTAERREGGARVGFEVRDMTSGTSGQLASIKGTLGPKVGKYRVNLADLASVGAKGLTDAAAKSELIVMDEVGPMELVSPEFRRAVRRCIDSGKPLLAVIHERLEDDLLSELRAKAGEVIEVDENNREQLVEEIADDLLAATRESKSS